jgi:hypothetical protein
MKHGNDDFKNSVDPWERKKIMFANNREFLLFVEILTIFPVWG